MFFTHNRVRYQVEYSFYPAGDGLNEETTEIEAVYDPAGREVSRELDRALLFRMATACRADVFAEVARAYERLREAARLRRATASPAAGRPASRRRRP